MAKKTEAKESGIEAGAVSRSRSSLFLRSHRLQAGLVSFAAFCVYIPALYVEWYFDDFKAILDNANIQSFRGLQYVLRNFIHRGVIQSTYAYDWFVSLWLGLSASGGDSDVAFQPLPVCFHLTSILIHVLVVFFYYWLLRKLILLICRPSSDGLHSSPYGYVPFVAALWFGFQPINTEAVTYLSGRASALAALEYIWGLLLIVSAAERFGLFDTAGESQKKRDYFIGSVYSALAVVCFIFGIGTKEIIVTLPVVAGLVLAVCMAAQTSWKATFRRLLIPCGVLVALLGVFFGYRVFILGGLGIPEGDVRPWDVNLYSQISIIATYYLPRQFGIGALVFDPNVPLIENIGESRLLLSFVIIVGLIVLAVFFIRREPLVFLGILWYFIALAPTSSFVPLSDLVAERRVYLPNLGFVMAITALCAYAFRIVISKQVKTKFLVPGLVFVGFIFVGVQAYKTISRNLLYADKGAFWQQTIPHVRDKARAYYNLGLYSRDTGKLEEAMEAFRSAAAYPGHFAIASANALSIIYMRDRRDYGQAEVWLSRCVELQPENERYWTNLGSCLLLAKDFQKAEQFYARWHQVFPNSFYSLRFWAQVLHSQQRLDEAEEVYKRTIKKYGDDPTVLKNLANIAEAKGDAASAEKYRKRLENLQKRKSGSERKLPGIRESFRLE